MTVQDSEGLTDVAEVAIVVGEPYSLKMTPKSGMWAVGDTITVREEVMIQYRVVYAHGHL